MTSAYAKERIADRVSRETFDRLEVYAALLTKWQKAINLVAPNTLEDLYQRHFLDSLQLLDHLPPGPRQWLDIGSGAGFPGLACAIAWSRADPCAFTLVESDRRKASFLREVARQTETDVTVLSERIENLPPQNADIITARALAPLPKLLALAHPHASPDVTFLFPKGAGHQAELASTQTDWHMKVTAVPSLTSENSVILRISDLTHAD